MTMFDEMSKTAKKFFEHLDAMLENDKDISINSTDELLRKYDKYTSEISKVRMIMAQHIDKSALVAEIEKRRRGWRFGSSTEAKFKREECDDILSFLDTLEVKDPYEQCVQYDSIKDGIQAHAETYSFNIESQLFNQLTKEQQALWRKEIEQACISGGDAGVELARDQRYKENLEVKEVDIASMADEYYDALIKEAEMDVDMAGHCRLAYYSGCKDVLNKIQKGGIVMKLVNVQIIKDKLERLIRDYRFYSSTEAKYRCEAYKELSEWLDSIDVVELSEDLEEAAKFYAATHTEFFDSECKPHVAPAFIVGAKWQEEQMEKNRIEHCHSITEEQYNLETSFVEGHIKKYHRIPTILDAIEYGMSLKKGE